MLAIISNCQLHYLDLGYLSSEKPQNNQNSSNYILNFCISQLISLPSNWQFSTWNHSGPFVITI